MSPRPDPLAEAVETPAPHRLKLWDWPVRIVHWSFALLLPALWLSWNAGQMPLHRWLGYLMLGLVMFRLYWGVAGSSTALFRNFVRGPAAVAAYFSGRAGKTVHGHNPLGALSVVAMLGLLAIQVALGLFSQDVDGLESGPLTRYVSYETADLARYWHGVVFLVLLGVVGLHLCAVVFYLLVKRDNLVGPMLTGRKSVGHPTTSSVDAPIWRLVVGIALGAGTAWWVSLGCPLPF